MFTDLKNLLKRLQKLNQNEPMRSVLDNTEIQREIIFLNQWQMYEEGVDNKGIELGQYKDSTIVKKKRKGQRYDHITLEDTSDFYNSMEVLNKAKEIVIKADMLKGDEGDLEKRFPDALGLTNESKQEIQELIKPLLKENILKALSK